MPLTQRFAALVISATAWLFYLDISAGGHFLPLKGGGLSLPYVAAAVAAVLGGLLARRLGPFRIALLYPALGAAAALLPAGYAPAASGAVAGLAWVVILSHLAGGLPVRLRGRAFGASPAMAVALAALARWSVPAESLAYLAVAAALASYVPIVITPPPQLPDRPFAYAVGSLPTISLFAVVFFAVGGAAKLAIDPPSALIAAVYAASALAAGFISDKYGRGVMIVAGAVLLGTSCFFYASGADVAAPLLAAGALALVETTLPVAVADISAGPAGYETASLWLAITFLSSSAASLASPALAAVMAASSSAAIIVGAVLMTSFALVKPRVEYVAFKGKLVTIEELRREAEKPPKEKREKRARKRRGAPSAYAPASVDVIAEAKRIARTRRRLGPPRKVTRRPKPPRRETEEAAPRLSLRYRPELRVSISYTRLKASKWGLIAHATVAASNSGGSSSSPVIVSFYVSSDEVLDAKDRLVAKVSLPGVPPGGSVTRLARIFAPGVKPGQYLIAAIDGRPISIVRVA